MRKYAILDKETESGNVIIKKIMLFQENKNNIYLFLYDNIDEDSSCFADFWFNNLDDALECIEHEYGLVIQDLIDIDDPLEYCQNDIITPIRVKGRNVGKEEWGKLEKYVEGKWIQLVKCSNK